ncbi:MAG: glycosyltransferase family 2 protein [Candidatus Nanohaloarchaea archaeon]|nr:glycosyltransferase family 2 protein [Candidatus Nanohaloarchaea archaeon]
MDVSVVIPTYNERKNIRELIQDVQENLPTGDHEVVVVDDGSPDGTADVVREAGEDDDRVRLVERDAKAGIGSAYKDAFREVEGDIVIQMDADFSHPPEHLPDLIAAVEAGNDVAVGSRYVEGGDRNDPLHRRIPPLIGSYLYRYGIGVPVRDITSGFKAYRRDVARSVAGDDLPDGYHFQAASLYSALQDGAEVEEVPIAFRPRRHGEPKYEYPWDLLDNLVLFGKLMLREREEVFKFATVGGIGTVVNMGLLYLLTEFAGIYYLASAVVAIEGSILFNFALNEVWTFAEKGRAGISRLLQRLGKANTVYLMGAAVNLVTLWALTELAGIYYLVSNFLGILAGFTWNYLGNRRWTWAAEPVES